MDENRHNTLKSALHIASTKLAKTQHCSHHIIHFQNQKAAKCQTHSCWSHWRQCKIRLLLKTCTKKSVPYAGCTRANTLNDERSAQAGTHTTQILNWNSLRILNNMDGHGNQFQCPSPSETFSNLTHRSVTSKNCPQNYKNPIYSTTFKNFTAHIKSKA